MSLDWLLKNDNSVHLFIETCLVCAFLFIFTAYHVYLAFRVRTRPLSTTIGQNYVMRKVWCFTMMPQPSRNIVAVQTIRNGLMASSLLASTSIALNTATFVFLVNFESIPGILDLNLFGTDRIKPAYKLLALTVAFLFSFFCYMQSIRMTNHASYQICLMPGQCEYVDVDGVSNSLNSSANFFTLGTRGYFLAFIIILWLFGPLPPLFGVLALIPVLYYLDIYAARETLIRTAASPASSDLERPIAGASKAY
jgi:uncharacterized membrane protein